LLLLLNEVKNLFFIDPPQTLTFPVFFSLKEKPFPALPPIFRYRSVTRSRHYTRCFFGVN